MRSRAIQPEEKEQRRQTILDAAERLWLEQREHVAPVEDIARAAGLGKGTVYLYFPSRESVLLAVHERHLEAFFDAVSARAADSAPMQLDDMMALTHAYIVASPAFLPIANLCVGLLERSIDLETALAFKRRMDGRLRAVAAALARHFPFRTEAQGVMLLTQSWALIVGLWQLLRPTPLLERLREEADAVACAQDYFTVLEDALHALWRGALEHSPPEHWSTRP